MKNDQESVSIQQQTNDQSPSATELSIEQLETVAGGTKSASGRKLYEATCKGTHIPEVTIE
jgi:cytochrome c5